MQGHGLPRLNARLKVFAQGVLQTEKPFLAQLHDRGSGELLRERSQSESRLQCVRSFPLRVRVAIAPGQEEFSILSDENSAGEVIAAPAHLHVAVKLNADLGSLAGHARC